MTKPGMSYGLFGTYPNVADSVRYGAAWVTMDYWCVRDYREGKACMEYLPEREARTIATAWNAV